MTKNPTKPFGYRGEQIAAEYLTHTGYSISAMNWRCPVGEIDIIAQQDNVLVFVEVRTRHSITPETAFESITPRKREKLTALAHYYLDIHDVETQQWRIDVVAIAVPPIGSPIIHHVEDALDW